MTISEPFTTTCLTQVTTLLEEIEEATATYAQASGLKCPPGCGQCCLKPGIEAQVLEMLPLAQELLKQDDGGVAAYEKALQSPNGVCTFYVPNAQDSRQGRCGCYQLRPSLCRLFGFAAVSGKDRPRLAACVIHKTTSPGVVAAAEQAIAEGGHVPLFNEFSLRLRLIAPGGSMSERLPINQALVKAMEKLSLAHTHSLPAGLTDLASNHTSAIDPDV